MAKRKGTGGKVPFNSREGKARRKRALKRLTPAAQGRAAGVAKAMKALGKPPGKNASDKEKNAYYDKRTTLRERASRARRASAHTTAKRKAAGSGGTVKVAGYTRHDGVKVKGYTRHAGKHTGGKRKAKPGRKPTKRK